MFKESLSGDASSNLDPSEEVTIYKIKKNHSYIASNKLVELRQQNWKKKYTES